MKEKYYELELDVITFDSADIIVTSDKDYLPEQTP